MAGSTENTLAKKKTRKKASSIGSTDSAQTVNSPSPKAILELGKVIVEELRLGDRGEVLHRWMSHHLAEQISKAESSSGAAKARHERSAVNLILKLWLHRRGLPEKVDPLAGYRDAIDALGRLAPDSNPWLRYRPKGAYLPLLQEMHDAMGRAIVGGIALTQLHASHGEKDARSEFLYRSEVTLLEAFARWLPIVERPSKPIPIVFLEADADDSESESAEPVVPPEDEVQAATDIESRLSVAVAEQLGRVHAELGRLIERWEAAQSEQA